MQSTLNYSSNKSLKGVIDREIDDDDQQMIDDRKLQHRIVLKIKQN